MPGWQAAGWGLLQAMARGGLVPCPVPKGPKQAHERGALAMRSWERQAPGAAVSLALPGPAWPVAGRGAGGRGCRGRGVASPTCLTVVAEEALWADAQVGPATVLTAASVLAGAGVAGIHLWRTPRESARAARGCLGEGGEDSGRTGRDGGARSLGAEAGRGLALPLSSRLGSRPPQACPRAPSPRPALSSPASVLVGNRCSQVSRVSRVWVRAQHAGSPRAAPTCLAVDSSETGGALADRGPREVPAGASVSAGLCLAFVCL